MSGGCVSCSMTCAFPRSTFMSAGVAQLVGSLGSVLHMSVTCVSPNLVRMEDFRQGQGIFNLEHHV